MKLRLIYDTTTQPLSVGDILTYQEMGLLLCGENGYDAIDFVFTYNPERPVVDAIDYRHITPDNFLAHLKDVLPLANASPRVESVQVLTHAQLERAPAEGYVQWPESTGGEYRFYEIARRVLTYYQAHGSIPRLSCKPDVVEWARSQFGEYVSVQLRRNPNNPERNLDYNEWLEFLAARREKFVIVCAPHEVDTRMRAPNVTFAKDLETDALQDVAIVQAAKAHMGACSGPCVLAMYNEKPYRLFNSDGPNMAEGWVSDGHRGRFAYSAPNQAVIAGRECAALLNRELEAML